MTYKCPYPWTNMVINYDGEISPCCYYYALANIKDDDAERLWNGKEMQALRARWVSGNLKGSPCFNCPGMQIYIEQYGFYPITDIQEMPDGIYKSNVIRNKDEYEAGSINLKSSPVQIIYVPSVICNIDCIHCCQPPVSKETNMDTGDLIKFYQIFGKLAAKHFISGGEPLLLKQVYKLFEEMPEEQIKSSELVLNTNGLLLKERLKLIPKFRKIYLHWSIASFRKDIYEYIHKGADYNILIENLKYVNDLRENEGWPIKVIRVMALMNSNYDDICEINREYGIDDVSVLTTHPSYGKYDLLWKESVVSYPRLLATEKGMNYDNLDTAIDNAKAKGLYAARHLEFIRKNLPENKLSANVQTFFNLIHWMMQFYFMKIFSHPEWRRKLQTLSWKMRL